MTGDPIEIDATGLSCPLPVLRLQKALRTQPAGSRLTLLASDPMAAIDVPHFIDQHGHNLLNQTQHKNAAPDGQDLLIFQIEKA